MLEVQMPKRQVPPKQIYEDWRTI